MADRGGIVAALRSKIGGPATPKFQKKKIDTSAAEAAFAEMQAKPGYKPAPGVVKSTGSRVAMVDTLMSPAKKKRGGLLGFIDKKRQEREKRTNVVE